MEDNKPDELEEKTEVVAEIEKENVSTSESTVTRIMTIGSDEPRPGQNMTTATVSVQTSTSAPQQQAKLAKVLVKYPDKWKKAKLLQDGQTYSVSPETAEHFIQMGIASLVKEEK